MDFGLLSIYKPERGLLISNNEQQTGWPSFSPTAKLCYGVFSPDWLSGAIRCSFNTRLRTRFRRVLVQIPREAPEGSGADTLWGSGGFRWRYLLRLRRVLCGSGGFRCRYLVRFQRVPVQILSLPLVRFQRVPVQILSLWGSGSFRCRYSVTRWGSGGLRCRYSTWLGSRGFWCRYPVRFPKFPV